MLEEVDVEEMIKVTTKVEIAGAMVDMIVVLQQKGMTKEDLINIAIMESHNAMMIFEGTGKIVCHLRTKDTLQQDIAKILLVVIEEVLKTMIMF